MTTASFTVETALDNAVYTNALKLLLYRLADDELMIGHRASEWLGLAPEIEEDVAFSSIAQDEVGHATFFYGLLAELGEPDADKLAFERPASARLNAVLAERENGDWAYTMMRHFFYDVFEDVRLRALEDSSYQPLRQGAVKIRREEYYHLLHHQLWVERLLDAGGEARSRMLAAIEELWEDVDNLFDLGEAEHHLVEYGIITASSQDLKQRFVDRVGRVLKDRGVVIPEAMPAVYRDRQFHTPALNTLLEKMTEVYTFQPGAIW